MKLGRLLVTDGAINEVGMPLYATDCILEMKGTQDFPIIECEGDFFVIVVIRKTDNTREDMIVIKTDGNLWTVKRGQGDNQSALDICAGSSVSIITSALLLKELYSQFDLKYKGNNSNESCATPIEYNDSPNDRSCYKDGLGDERNYYVKLRRSCDVTHSDIGQEVVEDNGLIYVSLETGNATSALHIKGVGKWAGGFTYSEYQQYMSINKTSAPPLKFDKEYIHEAGKVDDSGTKSLEVLTKDDFPNIGLNNSINLNVSVHAKALDDLSSNMNPEIVFIGAIGRILSLPSSFKVNSQGMKESKQAFFNIPFDADGRITIVYGITTLSNEAGGVDLNYQIEVDSYEKVHLA